MLPQRRCATWASWVAALRLARYQSTRLRSGSAVTRQEPRVLGIKPSQGGDRRTLEKRRIAKFSVLSRESSSAKAGGEEGFGSADPHAGRPSADPLAGV